MDALVVLFWVIFILAAVIPVFQRRLLELKRLQFINRIEKKRGTRVITMIHRQESLNILGIPIARYIDIEDSERILRAIRLTDPDVPIDLVIHTPGGLVLAAEQIACAIKRHPAKVTVFIPHFALSGGTLIALAADEIVMDQNAVLGPADPQIGDPQHGTYPAASILAALDQANPNRDDHILILGDIAKKAQDQVYRLIYSLISDKMEKKQAQKIAKALTEGKWTHDYPITVSEAQEMGLNVRGRLPKEFYELMDLYPQPPQRRPTVEYIPVPYRPSPIRRPGRSRD
jgi:ClpP class serine protease